jgi:hypothetical protein
VECGVGNGNINARYQKQFICTKRGGKGFFGRVSRVLHLAEMKVNNRTSPSTVKFTFTKRFQRLNG